VAPLIVQRLKINLTLLFIGLNMLVAHHPDEIEICKEEVVRDLARELGRIKCQDKGVFVQASTLGSLEALLEFLKDSKIPVSSLHFLHNILNPKSF
jgi:translation initiation factor IF-2